MRGTTDRCRMDLLRSERVEISEEIEEINRFFYEKGWSDGLPIIPPTQERVLTLLQGTQRKAEEVIGLLPPKWAEATIEKVAINAVMAGCLPGYMPTIIAVIEAMAVGEFNLYGIQTTTHPCCPLVIINGPIRKPLGINCGYGLLGPGTLANAVIGRAIRLILLNIGGAVPGAVDKATHGQPGKYTYVLGENEEESPWEPLHLERGFRPDESTVTVMAAEGPHNINDHWSTSAAGILTTIAGTLAGQGNNNILYQLGGPLILLGPEHAKTIAKEGFTKKEAKEFIFEKAKIPKSAFSMDIQEQRFASFPDEALIPVTCMPENMVLVVAGGAGRHSMVIPTFGNTLPVTKLIEE
jgi:hypothetical protein